MKKVKSFMIILTLSLFCIALFSPAALAANIVIDKQTGPAESGFFHTPKYTNDTTCIQAALDKSKSGDTITIHEGDYNITKRIYQNGKNLKIIGEGKVTFRIQSSENEIYGLSFSGLSITNQKPKTNANKGSSQLVLTDASKVRQNDLIKIWKNVQWCPLDYPDQMTGEIYAVKSVNGNVVTLNQPLLRDYNLSENVQVEVYRPIQVDVKNIRLEDTGATMLHHGLVMQYCKDSSVSNSWFNNSGFGAVCLYSCFNVSVNNNEIYNSLHPDCGYGVNVASGSAFINISDNHIENCRHTITGNTAERKSLNRDVFITDNTLIGGNINGSSVIDSHPVTINYVVTGNKIYPQLPGFFAFSDGTQQSTFSNNEIIGGYGGISKRGSLNDGVHIYENNNFNGISGVMYLGGINGTDEQLIIRNNTQNNGIYGIYFPYKASFRNIIINENSFSNLSHQGIYQKFVIDGVNLNISDNRFTDIKLNGIYIDGNSFKNSTVKILNNTLINVCLSNPSSGIIVKNVQNAVINGNKISRTQDSQVPVASFSASSTSGIAPLSVTFIDESTGTPTSWKWSFGDGTTSTSQNPTHTYSKAGKYTVTLTSTNAAGSNTATKSSYITVTTAASTAPTADFSASSTSGTAPLTVKFTDKSIGSPTYWKWSFGDGSDIIEAYNPTHTYTKAGTYTVKETVSNAAGRDTEIKTSYITVTAASASTAPTADFSASSTSGTIPLTVKFTDKSTGSPTYWKWSFGDGSSLVTGYNPTHTYTKAGTYTVKETVSNAVGKNTKIKTSYITVTVASASKSPVAAFSASPTSGNSPLSVTFTDQSTGTPTSWKWSFGDGTTSTSQNPTHTYTNAGKYTVTLTSTNAAGSNTATKSSYITVTAAAASKSPVADFSASSTSGTVPLTVKFTDKSTGSPTYWKWSFGDGSSLVTGYNPTHTYTKAGTYTVKETVSNAVGKDTEIKTSYITVTTASASKSPVADFSASSTSGTVPLTVKFTDKSTGSPTYWKWSFGDGSSLVTGYNPTHTYTKAGTYTVKETVSNAVGKNTKIKTSYITVKAAATSKPVADFSASSTSGKAPLTVKFTDKSTGSPNYWKWSFGDGSSLVTGYNPTHTYTKAGTYTVKETVSNAVGKNTKMKTSYITVT